MFLAGLVSISSSSAWSTAEYYQLEIPLQALEQAVREKREKKNAKP